MDFSIALIKPILWMLYPVIFMIIGLPAYMVGGQDKMEESMDKIYG